MIKIYVEKKDLVFSSELMIFGGLLEEVPRINASKQAFFSPTPEIIDKNNLTISNWKADENSKGEGRYHNIIETCNELIEYVDNINNCDILALPKKFNGVQDELYKKYNELAITNNKKLYCFFIDDRDSSFNISTNTILYRTSFNKSTKQYNELAIPAFCTNYYDGSICENISIGYCGHLMNNRNLLLKKIYETKDIKTDFKLRNGFWAPGVEKDKAREEFIQNIKDNLFTFCYRGAGNFSYRFYETLMMGRIPLLIDSDGVYPFENLYNFNNHCLYLKREDLNNFGDIFKSFVENNDLIKMQKNNHELWKKHFSAEGFIRTFISNL